MNDYNPFHRSDVGIVPGLLLTTYLSRGNEADLKIVSLDINFIKPIYVDEEFEVYISLIKSKLNFYFVEYEFIVRDEVRQKAKAKLVGNMQW